MSYIELDKGNIKEYKVKVIYDSIVYTRKLEDHLLNFYYLIF